MLKDLSELRDDMAHAAAAAWSAMPDGPKVADLVRQFGGRAARSSLFKIGKEVVGRGPTTSAKLADLVTETGHPAATARDIVEALPAFDRSLGAAAILIDLQQALTAAKQVIAYSRREDGSVRNAKLLLAASDNLRRGIETANRIFEAVHSVQRVQAFHRVVMEEIGRIAPDARKAILEQLDELARQGIE